VSQSKVETVKKYIENQKEHHKRQTFKEEYIQFLKENGVDYKEEYLWT
jgi:putative transposase